jgi:hypothetical protein
MPSEKAMQIAVDTISNNDGYYEEHSTRYQTWIQALADTIDTALAEAIASERERAKVLVDALTNARDAMEGWQGYASDYSKDKWEAATDLKAIDDAIAVYNQVKEVK